MELGKYPFTGYGFSECTIKMLQLTVDGFTQRKGVYQRIFHIAARSLLHDFFVQHIYNEISKALPILVVHKY